jgi:hypothetical protein
MDTHDNDDDERDWFEPIESAQSPEIMHHLGWLGTLFQPENRVLLLGALIGLTLVGGLSAGAFEGRQSATEDAAAPNDEAPKLSPVSAQKILQHHMKWSLERNPIELKTPSTTKKTPPAEDPTKLAQEKAVPVSAEKPVEAPPIEPINLKESLKLGKDALASKNWNEAAEHLEKASQAWTKKKKGKAWRDLRYGLSKAYYKTAASDRTVLVLEALLKSDPSWDKPLLLLGLAAKVDNQNAKAVKYLSSYLERGGTKVAKVCPYLEEQDAVDSGSDEVREACSPE